MDNLEEVKQSTGFSDAALSELNAPEADASTPTKRGRGRPKKKRGPGRPTREEAQEKKLTQEEQERAEISELLFQMLSPVNPSPRGNAREFHYTPDQLKAICDAAAPVWLKYMPTGPSKYSDEAQLLFVLGITLTPKFTAYRARRIEEGNPVRIFSRGWQWLKAKLTGKKYAKETFTPAQVERAVPQTQGDGYAYAQAE